MEHEEDARWPEQDAVATFFKARGIDWKDGGHELARACSEYRIRVERKLDSLSKYTKGKVAADEVIAIGLRAKLTAAQARVEALTETLAQVQRVAGANRVWAGDKWTYLGLTYVAQTKIVRLIDATLAAANGEGE